MTDIHVRGLSESEATVFDDLMRVTGGHIREEFHTTLAEWRHAGAVHEIDFLAEFGARSPMQNHGGRAFSVFGYNEAVEVLRDPRRFSSEAVRHSSGRAFGKTIITEDPPEHTQIRRLAQGLFTRKALDDWKTELFEPVIRAYVAEILPRGGADLHRDLLMSFPVTVLHRMLGLDVDPERAEWFHRCALQILGIRGDNPAPGLQVLEELYAYFLTLIETRRREIAEGTERHDIITQLVAKNDAEGLVDDEELARFLRILLPGGADTTTNASGNMFVDLLRYPDQLEKVRANPDLFEACVDETIRHENTSAAVYRGVTADTELAGVAMPAGSIVACVLGSANRDERRYDDADQFIVDRQPGGHVGFGHGLHLCIGAQMARVEMSVALEVILEQMPLLRPDPAYEPPYVRGALHRHPGHLKVRWD